VVVRTSPVAARRAVIVAPGITAPAGSVTRPRICVDTVCPIASAEIHVPSNTIDVTRSLLVLIIQTSQ
jgi:hypothetical protein